MLRYMKCVALIGSLILLVGCAAAVSEAGGTSTEPISEVSGNANDSLSQYDLGVGYLSADRYEEAMDAFEKAVEIDPHFAAAHFGIYCAEHAMNPRTYWYRWNERGSTEVLHRTASSDIRFHYALMYDPFFDWRPGALFVEKSPSLYSPEQGNVDLLWNRVHAGYEKFLSGDFKTAVLELSKALGSVPQYEQARFVRGLAYAQLRNYDAAIGDFFHILQQEGKYKRFPTLPFHVNPDELYYLIGYAFFKQEDLVNAKYFFEMVAKKNPSFYMAHVQLHQIYQIQKDYKKALEQLDAAVEVSPDDPILHFYRGEVLTELGDLQRAVDEYKTAISINPKYYQTHYSLAKVLDGLGDQKGAAESYAAFVDNAPDREQEMISEAHKRIGALRVGQ